MSGTVGIGGVINDCFYGNLNFSYPEHSCNRPCVDTVGLSLVKAETFPVEVDVQRVNDKGVQTIVEKKPEDIVAVVPL